MGGIMRHLPNLAWINRSLIVLLFASIGNVMKSNIRITWRIIVSLLSVVSLCNALINF